MEAPQNHKIHIIPLLFLLQFSWFQFTVSDEYLINCGSNSDVSHNSRNFVPESSLRSHFPKDSSVVKEDKKSSSTSPLYQTARIFRSSSSYKFRIDDLGGYHYHLVRLHFFAFSSPTNLSQARFNVSASGFWLLNNFSAANSSKSAMVEEFYLKINSCSFQIDFWPLESSLAFVNAIELLSLPNDLIPDKGLHVSSKGITSEFEGILSRVLHTSHRLKVGGSEESDNLGRIWKQDGQYAKNGTEFSSSNDINYNYKGEENVIVSLASNFTAPEFVYRTTRAVTNKSFNPEADLFNITWALDVKKNAVHLVRAHFCDIINQSPYLLYFNLYIYNNFSRLVENNFTQNSIPFYLDFVVNSDDSGIMSISICPDKNSTLKNAFLNGLEVMEITKITGPAPIKEYEGNHHLPLELGTALGGVALICILVGSFLLVKSKKPKPFEAGGSSHKRRGSSHGSSVGNLNLGLKLSFHEIQSATHNFDRRRIIGKGGFGNVYKGILKNGTKVAVKRREPGSGQGVPEFQTEIMVLTRIRHRHLVSLIGYCDERSEMILVYEYMEKGTLRDHLYKSNLPSLSWKQRLEICIGAARGLNYLHKGAAGGIIHRDVKSTNILLDENHVAKVADFGLSRTGPLDQQQPYVSTGVKGTFGYLDPEYFRTQQLTEKSDVYSFAVVLLEVLCARPALDPMLPTEQVNLAEWGMFCKNKGTLEEIIDPSIKGQIDVNSLRKFSETVEKCVQEDGCERPSMGDVLWDLEYSLQLQRGARHRKPHEDSSSGASASASLQLAILRSLPSLSTLGEDDDIPILKDDSAVNHVFSQMNVDGAR